MDDDSFLRQKSLPEWKIFLSERGVRISVYRKQELLDLARGALKQNLQPNCDLADESNDRLKRRAINDIAYPRPNSSNITWDFCLDSVPFIEAYDVQYYLKTSCHWTNWRLKHYKSDNSFRLHSNEYNDNVSTAELQPLLCQESLYTRGTTGCWLLQNVASDTTWWHTCLRRVHMCCVCFILYLNHIPQKVTMFFFKSSKTQTIKKNLIHVHIYISQLK